MIAAILVAVGILFVAAVVVAVSLGVAAKRGDRALGYEAPVRRCRATLHGNRCCLPDGHYGPHEMP